MRFPPATDNCNGDAQETAPLTPAESLGGVYGVVGANFGYGSGPRVAIAIRKKPAADISVSADWSNAWLAGSTGDDR